VAFYLNIKSPVKDGDGEAFRLVTLTGHEEISRLFCFTLGLQSKRKDIQPEEIIGKDVTFSVQDAQHQPRFFHGYVSRFTAGTGDTGYRAYEAEIVPWLWFLTRTADCRIFSKKKVPQILDAVFKDLKQVKHPMQSKLNRDYGEWEYCVQYRETDFNFVSRLMEQEGIFYYFEHKEGSHELVLCDQPGHYRQAGAPLEYEYYNTGESPVNRVLNWWHQYEFIPGKYAQTDYNFAEHPACGDEHPCNPLLTDAPAKQKPPAIDPSVYEIFEYPGEYEDKDKDKIYTELRMQREEVPYNVANGTSTCESLGPGGKFKLEKHPSSAENAEYAVVSIEHSAADTPGGLGQGKAYTNTFTCIPADVPFRPARLTRKPAIYGLQTAVVVGPKGQEIDADEYGRVLVQFFWDRYNTRQQPGGDEEKKADPVRVRVGQLIAGKQWGAMFVPRIGQEVVVAFEEGDPDRPLITGMVYNKDQPPPYDPKQEPTKSCVKTNSSPDGEGFNELRFEDKKGKEQIFIHAERDMDARIKNESRTRVISNSHEIIGSEKDGKKDGDQRLLIHKNQHVEIKDNRVEKIGGSMHTYVGAEKTGDKERNTVVDGDDYLLIKGNNNVHVNKDRNEGVDGNQSLTVGGNQQEKIGLKHAVEAGSEIHIKSGMIAVIEAGLQLTLKVGGNFITIDPVGVTIQGTLVMINSGGAPGTGSGSQPTAPVDALVPDPIAPDEADDAKSGQKSTPY
jgi:type VI secretion system secreted protein VgrG